MRRQVEIYAEWPDHPRGKPQWTCGSGHLLGGRLILTAAHVVCPARQPLTNVKVRQENGELLTAEVVWHRYRDGIDVALLNVTDPAWPDPVWRHPVRWGRLVTRRPGQQCEAIGFPRVVAEPRQRDSHHAVGVINPGSLIKAGMYAVEVTNPPTAPDADGSWWQGMSGAGVLCNGLLVGVVTEDPAGFGSRRLVMVPITAVTSDPDFVAQVVAHTGTAPVVEPVELAALAEPVVAPDSPAGLLRADVADTPFRYRPELAELHEWCQGPGWTDTRLVVGPGGQGKTRLARHLAAQLTGDGWSAIVLAERASSVNLAILGEVAIPTLVIVDYAESRTHQLDELIQAMARADEKVRLLLMARTAGAWRTERIDPSPHLAFLGDDRIVIDLSPVEPDPEGRAQAWEQAVAALAPRLGDLDGYRGVAWPAVADRLAVPELDGDRYRTILSVQFDALASLLQAGDPIAADLGSPGAVLLAHEDRYWTRVAARFGITLTPTARRCLVATATLWGAADVDDAHRVLAATLPGTDRTSVPDIADWLASLYQDGERYWSALQPDPLAEHLVGSVLGPDGRCSTLVGDTVSGASAGQLEHALTVLGRAQPRYPHLTQTIIDTVRSAGAAGGVAAIEVARRLAEPQPLLAALDKLITTADQAVLTTLTAELPRYSTLLSQTSLSVAKARVALFGEGSRSNRDTYLPDLASSLNDLAFRLTAVGSRAEGLDVGQEAVALCRELVDLNRDDHLPLLAVSLNDLAADLAEAGQREVGLTLAHEAVALRRELVEANGNAYLPGLATSVNNLAADLAEVGRGAEGLALSHEAVKLNRELVELNRDAHLPLLAASVNNLAADLAEAGQRAEGLPLAHEALALRRELVEHDRDAFLPDLATSAYNLAIRLAEAGRRAEGLTLAQEAVDLNRELVERNRDTHLPDLAMSMSSLANRLTENDRRTDALVHARKAAALYHELAATDPDMFERAAANADRHVARLGTSEH